MNDGVCMELFTDCSVVQALETATLHPAKSLNIDIKKGTLNFGSDSDFVFPDGKRYVLSIWIASKCVYLNPTAVGTYHPNG